MRIWVVTNAEPMPTDPGAPRLLRSGVVARMMAARGHDVVWWNANVDHTRRRRRFERSTRLELEPRLAAWCLDGRVYKRNVGIQRILSNHDVAAEFRRAAAGEPPPDAILVSYPLIELVRDAAAIGRARGSAVVADIRDLWPDVWVEWAPASLRPLARLAAAPFYRQAAAALRAVDAVFGASDPLIDRALQIAARRRGADDIAYPMAYPPPDYAADVLDAARGRWDRLLGPRDGRLVCCFFGNISARANVEVVARAAAALPAAARGRIVFVLCGAGLSEAALRTATSTLPNVVMPGWIDGAGIHALMERADVGLLPYASRPDLSATLPNKFAEYLSAGLPVVASLGGVAGDLIDETGCGERYAESDPADLAQVLLALADDPERLAARRSAARAVFDARLRAETVYGRMIDHVERLACAGRGGA